MAKQRPWDKYEVAILLDAYINMTANTIERKEAIVNVSQILRERERNAGIEIDDIFRNTSGISWQMGVIGYVMTNDIKGARSPRVFYEMATLYKTDRPAFMRILAEAKGEM